MKRYLQGSAIAIASIILGIGLGLLLNGYEVSAEQRIKPEIERYKDDSFSLRSYSYLVDKRTGVVYLEVAHKDAISVILMVNADGTPVTVEQLED